MITTIKVFDIKIVELNIKEYFLKTLNAGVWLHRLGSHIIRTSKNYLKNDLQWQILKNAQWAPNIASLQQFERTALTNVVTKLIW